MSENKEKAVSVMIDGELVGVLKKFQQAMTQTWEESQTMGVTVEPTLGYIVRELLRNSLGMKKAKTASQEGSHVAD